MVRRKESIILISPSRMTFTCSFTRVPRDSTVLFALFSWMLPVMRSTIMITKIATASTHSWTTREAMMATTRRRVIGSKSSLKKIFTILSRLCFGSSFGPCLCNLAAASCVVRPFALVFNSLKISASVLS